MAEAKKKAARKPRSQAVTVAAKAVSDPAAVIATLTKGRVKLTPENTKNLKPDTPSSSYTDALDRVIKTAGFTLDRAYAVLMAEVPRTQGDWVAAAEAVLAAAPHIEAKLVIGGIAYPIDPGHETGLERTIGAGRWGHGRGLVDAWPDEAWVGLLVHLGLPADPLDRAAADQPVKRLVQRLWYEACAGGVPEDRRPVFDARDTVRQKEYAEGFPAAAERTKEKKERARATGFGRSGEVRYAPTAALKDKGFAPGGQAALLLVAFKTSKWTPMSTQEAAAGMVKAGLVTTTKPERIAAFYLCKWAKQGLLTREAAG